MATFTSKPVEGQDPWGATDLAWRASVESAVNTVEGTANAALPVKGVIAAGTNLDTVTAVGVYSQPTAANATLALNYPVAAEGSLTVAGVGSVRTQQYTVTAGTGAVRGTYIRRYSGSAWEAWQFLPSQRVDQTAGRAIYTWDHLNQREQLIYGDTGWRDISGLLLNGWTGTVFLRRLGHTVFLRHNALNRASATGANFMTVPAGFASGASDALSIVTRPVTGSTPAYGSLSGGTLGYTLTDGEPRASQLSWPTTDAWPTSLPGIASGTIPNA